MAKKIKFFEKNCEIMKINIDFSTEFLFCIIGIYNYWHFEKIRYLLSQDCDIL